MNFVFDNRISMNSEYRSLLSKIVPEGVAPLILDPLSGLKGTPDSKKGFVFLTHLPTDILGYHGNFFEKYQQAPQWFFILLNKSDHGVILLKEAAIKYGLQNCNIFFAPNKEKFANAIEKISMTEVLTAGKVLFYSKQEKKSVEELSQLLFQNNTERFEIQTSANSQETDASILLLCGEEEVDFKNIKIPDNVKPIFVVLQPEYHVQQFINQDSLIDFLARTYHMTIEHVKSRIYFVSTKSEKWFEEEKEGKEAIENGILLWDSFGLPLSRKEYKRENISAFLRTQYLDYERLEKLFV